MAAKGTAKAIQRGVKRLQLSDGLSMAYQEWGASNPKRVLALHGWLDNSNSFNYLGPYLADRGFHVLAVDHIGHGLSDHLGTGAVYNILRSTACVNDFVNSLGWKEFDLLGHSMGAAICMMFAATMHELVDKMVLIEGFGPVTGAPGATAHNLRKAMDSEIKMQQRNSPPKEYSLLSDAITARINAVSTYPGSQSLSREAAAELIARGVKTVAHEEEFADLREESGPVCFRHDKRLVLPSYLYHTDDQVMSYMDSITAQTLLISAKNGWPFIPQAMEARKEPMIKKGLLAQMVLDGSHHLHLDPEHRGAVAEAVTTFLSATYEPRVE